MLHFYSFHSMCSISAFHKLHIMHWNSVYLSSCVFIKGCEHENSYTYSIIILKIYELNVGAVIFSSAKANVDNEFLPFTVDVDVANCNVLFALLQKYIQFLIFFKNFSCCLIFFCNNSICGCQKMELQFGSANIQCNSNNNKFYNNNNNNFDKAMAILYWICCKLLFVLIPFITVQTL